MDVDIPKSNLPIFEAWITGGIYILCHRHMW